MNYIYIYIVPRGIGASSNCILLMPGLLQISLNVKTYTNPRLTKVNIIHAMFLLPIGMFQQGLSRKYGVQLAMELGPILGYHAVLFIAHAAAYIYDCKYIVTNETETVFTYRGYGGKFKYLTNWNFVSPNIYLQLHSIMYTDMVIIVVYSATCTSYVLTQAKHAMVLHGRVNLGFNGVRCTEKKDQYCYAFCEGITAQFVFMFPWLYYLRFYIGV